VVAGPSPYPLFSLLSPQNTAPTIFLATTTHVILLRLAALHLLQIKHSTDYAFPTWRDFVFRQVWYLAIGWCAMETLVGVAQGYEQMYSSPRRTRRRC
jgi:hypothetical protein